MTDSKVSVMHRGQSYVLLTRRWSWNGARKEGKIFFSLDGKRYWTTPSQAINNADPNQEYVPDLDAASKTISIQLAEPHDDEPDALFWGYFQEKRLSQPNIERRGKKRARGKR